MARRRGNTAAGAGGAVLSIIAAPYLLAYFYPAIGAVVVIAAFADLILCLVRRGDDEARLLKWQHGLAAWCLVLGLVGLARGKSARDEDAQFVALVEQQRSDRALAAKAAEDQRAEAEREWKAAQAVRDAEKAQRVGAAVAVELARPWSECARHAMVATDSTAS